LSLWTYLAAKVEKVVCFCELLQRDNVSEFSTPMALTEQKAMKREITQLEPILPFV